MNTDGHALLKSSLIVIPSGSEGSDASRSRGDRSFATAQDDRISGRYGGFQQSKMDTDGNQMIGLICAYRCLSAVLVSRARRATALRSSLLDAIVVGDERDGGDAQEQP